MLLSALALSAATIAAAAVVRNRIIRRRLRFSLVALAALAGLSAAAHSTPPLVAFPQEAAVEHLILALAIINAVVSLAFNPWFQDRAFDRSPAIVQDTLVVGAFGGAAVFFLKDSTFLAASAIAAAAVGFALQDTLGNAFAGLAIQIEKPFRVGQWVSLAGHEGAVAEVTWRATKIRTRAGNLVVIPNSTAAREAINNYSEPAAPTRSFVDVGASYGTPPNEVREAIAAAMRQVSGLLDEPAPDVLLNEFAGSAITYRARFWVDDFARVDRTASDVRQAIYYEFRRRNIEIPWPIQIEYSREEPPADTPERRQRVLQSIAGAPVLAPLPAEAHHALAASAVERLYGDGEAIVREGDPGRSMFIVQHGRVSVTIGAEGREVAVTEQGGYFGEMSLLTGDPRSATVRAKGDCTVIEIDAAAFGSYVQGHPEAIDVIAQAAVERRRELDAARSDRASVTLEPITLADRIRRFFRVKT